MKKYSCGWLILLIVFNLLNRFPVYSQKCNCPEYYTMKAEWESSDADSKIFIDSLQSSSNKICIAKSYEWMAADYLEAQSFDTSDMYFQKAEKLLKQSACGDSILLMTYKNWAWLYYLKADFVKSQEYAFLLLKAAEAAGNLHETGVAYTMIAQLFNQTGQAEKGIVYTRKAIPYIEKIDDLQKKTDLLYKISKRYLWYYQDSKALSSLDSSELFSNQQLTIARSTKNKRFISVAFSNLEGIAWERGDLQKALRLIDSSFKYTDSTDYDNLGTNYYDKADILIELNRFADAKKMADSALYYRKLSGSPAFISELYEMIFAKIGEKTGDYKMAYTYKEMSRAISDSIKNVEKTKQVAELERKYSQAKNEKIIQGFAQQKRIYYLFALAGLLGLITLVFLIRHQSLKNKQKILETEQRLNRARINPHFFFNALSSLQSFVLQGNDTKSIAGNLSKFSHIMRETLESTYKEYVTVEEETDFLNEYLELQKVRFPQKFTFEVTASPEIEPDEMLLPSMILQPFVENSIEHGFTGIDYPGHISVTFNKKGNDLQINITDNGKGLATTPKEESEHISRASQIIKDRIYLLNIKLKTRAGFSIDNNPGGKGVIVKISLPVLFRKDIKNNG